MEPSLVTWPTKKTVTPCPLATSCRREAHSRTWLTLPAAELSASVWVVWMLSTMTMTGLVWSM